MFLLREEDAVHPADFHLSLFLCNRSHRNLLTKLCSVIQLRFCFGVGFFVLKSQVLLKYIINTHLSFCDVLFLSCLGEEKLF